MRGYLQLYTWALLARMLLLKEKKKGQILIKEL